MSMTMIELLEAVGIQAACSLIDEHAPDQRHAFAADVAETVLHLFEREYPDDPRPRQAIEAARGGVEDGKAAGAQSSR